jgi:hypothetical protein
VYCREKLTCSLLILFDPFVVLRVLLFPHWPLVSRITRDNGARTDSSNIIAKRPPWDLLIDALLEIGAKSFNSSTYMLPGQRTLGFSVAHEKQQCDSAIEAAVPP